MRLGPRNSWVSRPRHGPLFSLVTERTALLVVARWLRHGIEVA